MPLIVNLSTIHTLYPISTSVTEFAKLCNAGGGGCGGCCPTFFKSWSNYAWVMYQYQTRYAELIEPYKLGRISTEQFLENLAILFQVSEHNEGAVLIPRGEIRGRYTNDPRLVPLEAAWNSLIGLEENRVPRFPALVSQSEPVYLISNTNELNVFAILTLLREQNPHIQFRSPIDISVMEDNRPIEIADNIFLCLSYRYQCFKTPQQSKQAAPPSTMSLLKYLVEDQLHLSPADVTVVSQYDGDLAEAQRLKIPARNIHKADEFYSTICKDFKLASASSLPALGRES